MRFFTSDTHFGHHNVIEYCKRPYPSVYHMNQALIENWNAVVGPDDTVFFMGDWAMNPKFVWVLKYLTFGRVEWILGNHDKESKIRKMLEDPASEVHHLKDKINLCKEGYVELGGTTFHMVHRPIQGSNDHPVLCGHVHEKWQFRPVGSEISEHSRSKEAKVDVGVPKVLKTPVLNVGVDVHNYRPISEAEVLEFFK